MSARGETRQKAFQAACHLAARGQRPSVRSIRELLNGAGGQQAIVDGLNDWLDEAARRFQVPGLPDEILAQVAALWTAACDVGEARWRQDKASLQAQLQSAQDSLAEVTAECNRIASELEQTMANLEAAHTALSAMEDRAIGAEARLQEERQTLASAQTELAAVQSARETLTRDIEYQRRLTEEARTSQQHVEADLVAVRVAVEARTGRIAVLETSLAEAGNDVEELRTISARQEAMVAGLTQRLSDRDATVAKLTAALDREQQGREADTEHWLKRLDEIRTAGDEARTREVRLVEENDRLVKEIHHLRQALTVARSEIKRLSHEASQKRDPG